MALFKEWNRRVRHELICVNTTLALIMAGVFLLGGILSAISGVNGDFYENLNHPLCEFSPFWICLFWGVAYAVFGATYAVALSAPYRHERKRTVRFSILYFSTLILSYLWIPVVYSAGSFLLGTLLCAVILIDLAVLFSFCAKISRLASWGILGFAGWMLYILYVTFALFLLN